MLLILENIFRVILFKNIKKINSIFDELNPWFYQINMTG